MKLHRNFCLIALLIAILMYCCLGTSLLEGLSPGTPEQGLANGSDSNDTTYPGPRATPLASKDIAETTLSEEIETDTPASKEQSNTLVNSIAKIFTNTPRKRGGLEKSELQPYQNPPNLPPGESCKDGYQFDENGYCKPLDSTSSEQWSGTGRTTNALQPDTADHKCDTGFVWKDTVGQCVRADKRTSNTRQSQNGNGRNGNGRNGNGSTEVSITDSLAIEQTTGPPAANTGGTTSSGFGNLWGGNGNGNRPTNDLGNGLDNNQKQIGTYPAGVEIPASQILPGQEDMYILKSQIVPPVCPACPPVLACEGQAKCPPCPAPNPIQPCPPCGRCPEPAFDCKKVPNYGKRGFFLGDGNVRPILNDFSQFT